MVYFYIENLYSTDVVRFACRNHYIVEYKRINASLWWKFNPRDKIDFTKYEYRYKVPHIAAKGDPVMKFAGKPNKDVQKRFIGKAIYYIKDIDNVVSGYIIGFIGDGILVSPVHIGIRLAGFNIPAIVPYGQSFTLSDDWESIEVLRSKHEHDQKKKAKKTFDTSEIVHEKPDIIQGTMIYPDSIEEKTTEEYPEWIDELKRRLRIIQ